MYVATGMIALAAFLVGCAHTDEGPATSAVPPDHVDAASEATDTEVEIASVAVAHMLSKVPYDGVYRIAPDPTTLLEAERAVVGASERLRFLDRLAARLTADTVVSAGNVFICVPDPTYSPRGRCRLPDDEVLVQVRVHRIETDEAIIWVGLLSNTADRVYGQSLRMLLRRSADGWVVDREIGRGTASFL